MIRVEVVPPQEEWALAFVDLDFRTVYIGRVRQRPGGEYEARSESGRQARFTSFRPTVGFLLQEAGLGTGEWDWSWRDT